jgi:arylsulfatase A-like enzyme/tetratricopeptide (TPR) repeat protein
MKIKRKRKNKSKKIIFILVICILAAAVVSALLFLSKGQKKIEAGDFNLLVITLDTTRADRLGVYGYEPAQTPNLDFLAQNGIMAEQCYTPVPLTLPAHCSLFTGKYPISLNVRDNGTYILGEGEVTLAEKMKEKNYHTFAVIAAFVLLSKFGLAQGFDLYDDSLNSHKMYNNYTSEIPADDVFRKFMQWFEKNHQRRFFAWVHLYDPHTPYTPPKKYAEKFEDSQEGRYDGEIAFADSCVGEIIKELKSRDILQNTLIVIVGDHGEAFGEHQEYGHGIFCYEEALKVPLIFYNPRLFPRSRRLTSRLNLIDIMPTLLELYGLPISPEVQGKSFAPLLAGNEEEDRRGFYFESMHGRDEMGWAPLTGLIHGQHKYISLPKPELYDLDADKGEKENLFLKQNRLAKELDQKLMKWVAELSKTGGESRRGLSPEDRRHLQSLGYISSFSAKSDQLQNIDPKQGIVLDNKIKALFDILRKGRTQLAGEKLAALESEYPGIRLPVMYDLKDLLYKQQNKIGQEIGILQEAREKFPDIERFHIMYALKVFELGKLMEAQSACQQVLKLNPRFTRAHILMAEIQEKLGHLDEAVEQYGRALELEPQNISLKLKYAELLIEKKKYETALRLYDELLERREISANPELLYKVALFNAQYGTLKKAAALLERAIGVKPNGKYYFNHALILAKMKRVPEALKSMETALSEHRAELDSRQIEICQKAINMWRQRPSS